MGPCAQLFGWRLSVFETLSRFALRPSIGSFRSIAFPGWWIFDKEARAGEIGPPKNFIDSTGSVSLFSAHPILLIVLPIQL